jgi:predicted DNA-binding protein (MmcQ/YjbR family)
MDLIDARAYCLSLPHVEECLPFGPDTLVFKIAGKLFALTTPEEFPPRMNLKCDPERSLELRDQFPSVLPGYHMNKRHWNTLVLDGSLPGALVKELIRHSYDLVVAGLPAAARKLHGL